MILFIFLLLFCSILYRKRKCLETALAVDYALF